MPLTHHVDSAVYAGLLQTIGRHQHALVLAADLGERVAISTLSLFLVVSCLAVRRLNGALLAVTAIPVAAALTEYALKPLLAAPARGGVFPSGHTTAIFAMAGVVAVLLATPSRRISRVWRLTIALGTLVASAAVGVAVIGLGMHTFTDALGGAAVGVGVVLLVALLLDLPAVRQPLTTAGGRVSNHCRQVRRRRSSPDRGAN